MTKKIAVLPGDGVGNEVMEAALIVLDQLDLDVEYEWGDIGWEFWKTEGDALPARTVELLKRTDACLFGAITSMPKEECEEVLIPELKGQGLVYRSPIVRLRQMFDLYVNYRPCKAFKNNPLIYREGIDLHVFRENTEGLYAGIEFHPLADDLRAKMLEFNKNMGKFDGVPGEDIAMSCRVFSRKGCERIVRAGFELARDKGYKTVTVVEKPNVVRETSGMMIREARKVAKEFPGIELWETNIDAMCMWLIKNPLDYGVLVTSNMFGDIVSDLCAQLVGGLGFAASASRGDSYALFEPTHGSAPKYYGQYKVNPIAMILSAKLMLEYIGEGKKADAVEQAVADVVAEGKVRTYDMRGSNTSLEVAEAIAAKLR
ncbi:MAG TPA: isocitrate/isopropylmalate dehydrogenase family protein [candidate division Zixibacteria bacterium]|nr:isocitrate/isopropylmalate dehydrogenase family protein [candidate division Zixibacteria bacterium]